MVSSCSQFVGLYTYLGEACVVYGFEGMGYAAADSAGSCSMIIAWEWADRRKGMSVSAMGRTLMAQFMDTPI